MDNFQRFLKHKKIKFYFVCASILLPIIIIILLEVFQDFFKSTGYQDLLVARYFIFAAIEIWLISKIVHYTKIIFDPEYAKTAYVKLTDERISFVKMRANALSFKLILYFMLIAILISGFYNRAIFYTLLSVLGAAIVTVIATTIYYMKKY